MEHNNITVTLKLINDLVEKKANSELGKYNITLSQARILAALFNSKADNLSLKALEKLFNVSQATMQGTISRLNKKGFVDVSCLPNDKKTKYVSLTHDGKLLVGSISKCIGDVNRSMTENLTNEELDEFYRIMTKMYTSLKEK
ncbi:MAG: MarR family transcriptional regulator [Oscillospiraceae bacterium]|nr:MarR family transcriptional regulator [Oscillospiraceae bacterium]